MPTLNENLLQPEAVEDRLPKDELQPWEKPVPAMEDWEVPVGDTAKFKENLMSVYVADRDYTLGMPAGKDYDAINQSIQTTLYKEKPEEFVGGVNVMQALKNNYGKAFFAGPAGLAAGVAGDAAEGVDVSSVVQGGPAGAGAALAAKFPEESELFRKGVYAGALHTQTAVGGLMVNRADKAENLPLPQLYMTPSDAITLIPRIAAYGINKVSGNFFGEKLDEYGHRLVNAAQNTIVQKKLQAGPEFKDQVIFGLGQGSVSILSALGIGYVTRSPQLVGVLFGMQMKGAKYIELKERGFDDKYADDLSTVYGIGEGALEYLGLDIFMNAARGSRVLKSIFGKTVARSFMAIKGSKPVARTGVRVGSEVVQEGSQQGNEGILDKYLGGQGEKTWGEIGGEVGMSMLLGGLLSMPIATQITYLEENTTFGQIRKDFELTDEETVAVVTELNEKIKANAGKKISQILDEEASKLELDNAEKEKDVPREKQVADKLFGEALQEQQITHLESLRAELLDNSSTFSEGELEESLELIDEKIAEVRKGQPQAQQQEKKETLETVQMDKKISELSDEEYQTLVDQIKVNIAGAESDPVTNKNYEALKRDLAALEESRAQPKFSRKATETIMSTLEESGIEITPEIGSLVDGLFSSVDKESTNQLVAGMMEDENIPQEIKDMVSEFIGNQEEEGAKFSRRDPADLRNAAAFARELAAQEGTFVLNGNVYLVERGYAIAEQNKTKPIEVPMEGVWDQQMQDKIGSIGTLEGGREADLSIPGLVAVQTRKDGSKGYVLIDGWNRAAKALAEGKPLMAYPVPIEQVDAMDVYLSSTDNSPRFSRKKGQGMLAQDVEAIVDELGQQLKNLPGIGVVQTLEEARNNFPNTPDDVEGFYDDASNTIILIADNISDANRAKFVILHEAVGHYGLSAIFNPKELKSVMGKIYSSNAKVRSVADEKMKAYGYTKELATEEALADMAGNEDALSALKKPLAILRKAMRDAGIDLGFTDDDVLLILEDSRAFVEEEVSLDPPPAKKPTAAQRRAAFDQQQIEAEIARDQLNDLLVIKRGLKGKLKRYPDGFMAEEMSKVPKYYFSKDGMVPDALVSEINSLYGTQLEGMDQLFNFLAELPAREAKLRQKIKAAIPERKVKSQQTLYNEQDRTASAKKKIKEKGKAQLNKARAFAKKKDIERRARAKEVKMTALEKARAAKDKRIDALKERIVNLKLMSNEQKDAIRQKLNQKLADQKRVLINKLKVGKIKRRDLELYARENLPKARRGRYLRLIARTTSNTDMAKAFARITEGIEQYRKDVIQSRIESILKRAAKSSKLSIDYKNMIAEIGAMFSLTTPRAATLKRLQATKNYVDAELAAGRNPEVPMYILETLSKLNQKPLGSLTIAEMDNILDRLNALVQLGTTKLKARKNIYAALQENRLKQLMIGTKNWNTAELADDDTGVGLEAEKLTGQQRIKNAIVASLNNVRMTRARLLPIDVIFDVLDGGQDYQGPNFKIFKKEMDTAYGNYLKFKMDIEKTVVELAKKLGLDDQNFKRIGIYAADQQEGGREKLLAGKISEKEIDSLYPGGKNALTEAEIELYNEMRAQLDLMRPIIAEVMAKDYNQDLGSVANYFPFMADFDAMAENEIEKFFGVDMIEYDQKPRKNVDKAFTKERVGGALKIRLNAMNVFLSHLDNASYLIHAGSTIKQLSELAQSDEYAQSAGDIGQRLVVEWTDILARKGVPKGSGKKYVKFMNVLRKNVGLATLGFRVSSTAVQTMALFDGAALVGPSVFKGARDIGGLGEGGKAWRKFLKENFPELAARIGDDPNYMDFGGKDLQGKVGEYGFWALKKLDLLTAMAVTAGAYSKIVESKGGKVDFANPDPAAIAEATRLLRRSQASAFFKDSPLALSQGIGGMPGLGKAVFQFQSFMLNRWSAIEHDILAAGFKRQKWGQMANGVIWLTIALAAETGMRRGIRSSIDAILEGITGDSPDRDDETFLLELAENAMQTIPVFSQLAYQLGIMNLITGRRSYSSGQLPVPMLKMVGDIIQETGWAVTTVSEEKKAKHAFKAVVMFLGAAFGAAGAGPFADFGGEVVESLI